MLNFIQVLRRYVENETRAETSHKDITSPFYFLHPEVQVPRFSTLPEIISFPSVAILRGKMGHLLILALIHLISQDNTFPMTVRLI